MLFEQIRKRQMKYRIAKDNVRKTVLTTLIGELQKEAINSGSVDKSVSDELCLTVLKKFIDGNKEMMAIKPSETLKVELEVLMDFMPDQLSLDELETIISDFVADNDLKKEGKSIGVVMGFLNKTYPSKFDGGEASSIVKRIVLG